MKMPEWTQSESEVLRRIVRSRTILSSTIHFALSSAFPHPQHPFGQDVLVGLSVPRTDFGLSPQGKPGDIDLLIVPVTPSDVLVDQVIAIEVKILRPTIEKPSRNVGSYGLTQARGLLQDGFPFVGLIHISIPEQLPKEFHVTVPVISGKVGHDGKLHETGELAMLDPFPLFTARRQHGRIHALPLPPEIGYRVVAMGLSPDNESFRGCSFGESRCGLRNPNSCSALAAKVRAFVVSQRNKLIRVQWYTKAS